MKTESRNLLNLFQLSGIPILLVFRLAYIAPHPVQYQAPLLRLIASSGEIDLKVFFLSDFSLHAHHERAFNRTFKWDVSLTDGYNWGVLSRWFIGPSRSLRAHWPVAGLKRCLKEGRFDAVWVHGWGHIGLRQASGTAIELRIPLLLRGETAPDSSRVVGLKRWLRNRYCRRLVALTSACLCIGSLNREFYRQFGACDEKLFDVPYAVDNAWFQKRVWVASARRESLRAKLGMELGRPVILFAAKFIPDKAPADLIAAYQRVWRMGVATDDGRKMTVTGGQRPVAGHRGRGKKPYLLLVGDGPLRGGLEAQAGKLTGTDIRFLGFKNQTELPALYDLCDIFVLPSIYEPWGLVLNEVMNAAKPVIVSDRVGAAPDLVKHGVNGWIFPSGDIIALGRSLAEAFNSSDLKTMGRQSLEIINRWDFNADLRGLLTALETVCQSRCKSNTV